MGKKTRQIREDIEATRGHMTELLDEVATKFDVRSFAKRNAVLLGSAAVAVGLAVGLSIWLTKGARGGGSNQAG